MNYRETIAYLTAHLPMYQRIGPAAYKADLGNTIAICSLLGNPQHSFRSVHIAGTNGKGSTSHMLASIFQEKGFKTGLYTSPHLVDFRERIRVNGIMIPKEKVVRFLEEHKESFEKIAPSFFEMTVGLAFNFFREEKVDVAIIETGLGGRLDSTNIITPLLSVITNISIDHKQFLGDTIEKIALEKAGIIKKDVPVVIGENQPEIRHIFMEKARNENSWIVFAEDAFKAVITRDWEPVSGNLKMDIYEKNKPYLAGLESPLGGIYQMKNIVTVCAACEMLKASMGEITGDEIRRGILHVTENTGLAGRWQILSRNPLTICDTGHNEAGIQEVLEQIKTTPHQKLHFVFGMVNDKEIGSILRMLPKNAAYYFCKADIPRGMDASELKRQGQQFGLKGEMYDTVKLALSAAQKVAAADDLVFVGGSTFVVAEVV